MQVFTKKKLKDLSIYGIGQAINILSPLVIIPYLILICGEDGLGKIGVGFSLALILNSIIDYGSYINGVKDISINRFDNDYIVNKTKAIFTSKLILLTAILAIMSLAIFIIPYLAEDKLLFFMSLSVVVGQFLNPAWFFQGIEDYKWISFSNLLSKIIYISGVLLFIQKEDDYILANLFFGSGAIIANSIALVYIIRKYRISLNDFSLSPGINIIKEEFAFSISQVFLSVYQFIPIIIISYIIGNFYAGQFRVIDQVTTVLKSYLIIFFYFIFSNICYEINNNRNKGLRVWAQFNFANFLMIMAIIIFFYFNADVILLYFKLNPAQLDVTRLYFRIGLVIPFLISVSLPLRQLMFAFEKNRIYINITIVSTIVNILLLILLTNIYGLIGAFISIILIEIIIIVLYCIILYKHLKRAENDN